jgi:hypothetical protein
MEVVVQRSAVRTERKSPGCLDVSAARSMRSGRATRHPIRAGGRNFKFFVSNLMAFEKDAELSFVGDKSCCGDEGPGIFIVFLPG